MGSLQARCALACDVLRRAGEIVAMAESAAPIHAVCLARADGRSASLARVTDLEVALAARRADVDDACADLAGALELADRDAPGADVEASDALLALSLDALTSRVAKHVASLLEQARDADAEIDDVLAGELDVERRRWLTLVAPSAARVCEGVGPSHHGAWTVQA